MGERITDQKLKNQRFRKTEETIIINFCLLKGNFSVKKLIKTAKISHSTFYRHHQSVYEIVPSYERYILQKYKKVIKKTLASNTARLPHLFRNTLIFLSVHQKIMKFLLEYGSSDFTEKLLSVLSSKLFSTGRIRNQTMFEIYLKEISVLINQWQKDGFRKDEIAIITDKIMYLTDTARTRLGPVAN